VARRRMVLRRIDPFSVLKFGAVAHLALAAIGFVALTIVTRVLLGSGLVGQICEIAADVGFLECGVEQGRVTRLLAVLAIVWAVVQTALVVLLAFLHNLIADLTGGIAVTFEVETPSGGRPVAAAGPAGPTVTSPGAGQVVARPGPAGPNDQTTTVEPVDAIEAVVQPRPRPRPSDGTERGTAGGDPLGGGRLFGGRG
jgi:hypothetical protein